MVVHHLLDIDIYIHAKNVEQSFDPMEEDKDGPWMNTSEGSIKTEFQGKDHVLKLLVVMDAMLELVFDEMERQIKNQKFEEIWKSMLTALDVLMITTREARFPHFLIFFLAQKRPETCISHLTKFCLEKIQNKDTNVFLRGTYASYIASFLSRIGMVSNSMKLKYLERLLCLCEQHAREYYKENNSKSFANPFNDNATGIHEVLSISSAKTYF